jgi:hypothetical protein
MGQFKPMVKMETTEPSVILKLKKGGHVAMPKKAVKKMNGGTMGALAAAPSPRTMPVAPTGRAPARPSLAERRRAMMGKKGMAAPMMAKKGGEMESKAMHAKEATKAELKAHADKPASKAHKGLKTGGVVKGQGGYKTGGVVNCKATGGVIKGQGGYKKGGAAKKFAKGGLIDDGRPEKMPQGNKTPSAPVSISRLSATFKKGGAVKKADGGQMKPLDAQAARETKGYEDHYKRETEENRAFRAAMNPMNLLRKARDAFSKPGSVTTTEEKVSQTVSPAPQKKRHGGYSKGGRC